MVSTKYGYIGEVLSSATLMHRGTGKDIDDLSHLKQSIVDILTTRVGSRVYRRDYGSRLFYLIDRNIDATFVSDFVAATVDALTAWEPRLKIQRVLVDTTGWLSGHASLTIEGVYLLNGKYIRLEDVSLDFYKTLTLL